MGTAKIFIDILMIALCVGIFGVIKGNKRFLKDMKNRRK